MRAADQLVCPSDCYGHLARFRVSSQQIEWIPSRYEALIAHSSSHVYTAVGALCNPFLYCSVMSLNVLWQVMVLMAEVRKLATISSSDSSHGKFYPTVFAGDFNLVPFSPLYWFLVTGGLFYAEADQFRLSGQNSGFRAKPIRAAGPNHYLEKSVGVSNRCVFEDVSGGVLVNDKVAVTHEFGLSSVYQHFFNRDEPEFTTFHDRQCATVDYILFSSNCFLPRSGMGHLPYSQKLQLLGRRCLVRHKSLGLLGPLPNAKCPSDHLSIQAFFQFVGGPSDLADEESTSGSSKKARL